MSNGNDGELRESILDGARQCVLRERNATYGEPDQDFTRTADVLSALGFCRTVGGQVIPRTLTGADIAQLMIALKLSRLAWSPTYKDNWVDIAGYAACGYETATMRESAKADVPMKREVHVVRERGADDMRIIREVAAKHGAGPVDLTDR